MQLSRQHNSTLVTRGVITLIAVDLIIIGGVFYGVWGGGVNGLLYHEPKPTTSASISTTVSVTSSTNTSSASTTAYTIGVASSKALGSYLVDGAGFTLYYFVPDTVGNSTSPPVSACTTSLSCIQVWPAFYASNIVVPPSLNASDFTTFTRSDGTNQTAYLGHPLYLYLGDTSPGQTNGNAININGGYWYAVPASPTATFKT